MNNTIIRQAKSHLEAAQSKGHTKVGSLRITYHARLDAYTIYTVNGFGHEYLVEGAKKERAIDCIIKVVADEKS